MKCFNKNNNIHDSYYYNTPNTFKSFVYQID